MWLLLAASQLSKGVISHMSTCVSALFFNEGTPYHHICVASLPSLSVSLIVFLSVWVYMSNYARCNLAAFSLSPPLCVSPSIHLGWSARLTFILFSPGQTA